jgi:hypothetical protein
VINNFYTSKTFSYLRGLLPSFISIILLINLRNKCVHFCNLIEALFRNIKLAPIYTTYSIKIVLTGLAFSWLGLAVFPRYFLNFKALGVTTKFKICRTLRYKILFLSTSVCTGSKNRKSLAEIVLEGPIWGSLRLSLSPT